MSTRWMAVLTAGLMVAVACEQAPLAPPGDPAFAKGGKPAPETTSWPMVLTVFDEHAPGQPADVLSDGLGDYVDGQCGVVATMNVRSDGKMGGHLAPAGEASTCPRAATLHLLVQHLTDDPHVDSAESPRGAFAVTNFKFVFDTGNLVVNAPVPLPGTTAPSSCFEVSRNGRYSGQGLRMDATNFPGSNSLEVIELGTRHYRMRTRPAPDNVAYCHDGNAVTFWHVAVDMEVRALP